VQAELEVTKIEVGGVCVVTALLWPPDTFSTSCPRHTIAAPPRQAAYACAVGRYTRCVLLRWLCESRVDLTGVVSKEG
jgi:hypothetical protein